MSKNNNVNPGQYKVAGRERQGEDLDQTREKQELKESTAEHAAEAAKKTPEPQQTEPQKKSHASGR